MYQVRLHGRGGQGVVTAAELIAWAAIADGHYALAFPSFGSERTGAPVAAYCRIDDKPIRSREPVTDPDAVVVLDPTLLRQPVVFVGLKPGGLVLANAAQSAPAAVTAPAAARVYTVPATEIAREWTGRPLPNVPMLGAFAAASGAVTFESVRAAIGARFAGRVAETNGRAASDAREYVLRDAVDPAAPTAEEAPRV